MWYFLKDSHKLFLQSSFGQFAGDGVVGQVIDPADLPFAVGEDPHKGAIFIIEDNCVGDIEFEFEFMEFVAGSESEKFVEVAEGGY